MKRRTRLIFIGCAAASGTFYFATPEAVAMPVGPVVPHHQVVVQTASDPPPRVVHAPTVRVTVRSGDTLTAIGARTSRTWEQLASYNHLPNPNLIFTDQVLTIPPASYVPPSPSVQPVHTAPVAHHPAPAPSADLVSGAPDTSGVWACIGEHESGNNAATNTGNGYYGAFQDTLSAWQEGGGGPGLPSDYSYAQQLAVNQRIQALQGWGAWPVSSGRCGV